MKQPSLLRYLLVLGLVLLAVLPFILNNPYYISILIFIGINSMLALGLCMVLGYAGQISLGHSAFYGLGAYTSAILSTKLALSPWLAMLVGAILTAIVAYIVGIPVFRLRGHYLAMATLALGLIVYVFFVELRPITGGPTGVIGIPPISIGSFVFDTDVRYYYLVWTAAIICLVLSLNIVRSRVGRALRAIRGSEGAASALGVDITGYKLKVFTLTAVFASIAGSLYAHYVSFISPSPFGFPLTIQLLTMVVIGGMASIPGSFLGAGIIVVLTEVLRTLVTTLIGKSASGEYEIIVFGIILTATVILLPHGMASGIARVFSRTQRQNDDQGIGTNGLDAALRLRSNALDKRQV